MLDSAVSQSVAHLSTPAMPSLLDAALEYAARGFFVIPLHTALPDGRCGCGDRRLPKGKHCGRPGKHPRVRRGLKAASNDPERILQWWTRWPDANIGIVTGAISGIIVLDIDGLEGERSLAGIVESHGAPPDSLAGKTGGGGRHLVFKHPGKRISNRQGLGGLEGLDVRGDGGYIVAPPSLHASGQRYEWIQEGELADADWFVSVLDTLCPAPAEPEQSTPEASPYPMEYRKPRQNYATRSVRGDASQRAESYLETLPPAISGQNGHTTCFKAALAMVRGFRLSTNQAFELLRRKYNPRCQPAWSEKELWHKVEDAEISGKLPLGYLLDAPLSKASAGRSQRVSTPSVPFVPPVGLVTKIQAAQIAGRCKRTIRRWVTSGFLRDARSDGDQLSHLVIDRSELEAYLEGVDKEVFSPLDNALLDPPDALSTPLAKQCHPPARLPLDIHISGDLPLAPAAPLASLARTGPPESRARVNSRVLLAGAHYAYAGDAGTHDACAHDAGTHDAYDAGTCLHTPAVAIPYPLDTDTADTWQVGPDLVAIAAGKLPPLPTPEAYRVELALWPTAAHAACWHLEAALEAAGADHAEERAFAEIARRGEWLLRLPEDVGPDLVAIAAGKLPPLPTSLADQRIEIACWVDAEHTACWDLEAALIAAGAEYAAEKAFAEVARHRQQQGA